MIRDNKKIKIAFVVEDFPVVSQTFIIDQIADLKNRGIDIQIFSLKKGGAQNISDKFKKYDMGNLTCYLGMPTNKLLRLVMVIPKALRLLINNPTAFMRALNIKKYGKSVLSLRTIYLTNLFYDKEFDLVHCHFGTVANEFLVAKEILGLKQKFLTTFYGYDASRVFKEESPHFYDGIKNRCSLFLVMSNNMRERLIEYGFDENKIIIHPPGVNIDQYRCEERKLENKIEILSIGRFTKKKGLDDLLRALKIVKEKTTKPFGCTIIGDGPLRNRLFELTNSLNLDETVKYKGYMKVEEINNLLPQMHFYVQPSKMDSRGNME